MKDQVTVRVVVIGLIVVVVGVLTSVTVLLAGDNTVPDALWVMGSTALGALGALAAKSGVDVQQVTKVVTDILNETPHKKA